MPTAKLRRPGHGEKRGLVWWVVIAVLSMPASLLVRTRYRNLDRLPESGSFETADDPGAYVLAARGALGRRWRIAQREEPSGLLTLSAEKGYSRETGNLIFHVALLVSLVLIAVGRLYSYQGSRIVIRGLAVH